MAHFDFQVLGVDGVPKGEVHQVVSTQGVLLLCPHNIDPLNVGHLCRLAQDTPDYPHDLCIWKGPDPNPTLVWSARIHWRMK